MQAPSTPAGHVGLGIALVFAGAAVGGGVGYASGHEWQGYGSATRAALVGALGVGIAGAILAAASPGWRTTGEVAATVGMGLPLVATLLGAASQQPVAAVPPPAAAPAHIPPAGPVA